MPLNIKLISKKVDMPLNKETKEAKWSKKQMIQEGQYAIKQRNQRNKMIQETNDPRRSICH